MRIDIKKIVIWTAVLLISWETVKAIYVQGCTARALNKEKINDVETAAPEVESKAMQPFSPPTLPAAITSPEERAKWLVAHYWDNYNFADTASIHLDKVEQAFVDYLDILPYTTEQAAGTSLREVLVKARPVQPVFDWFTAQFDRYLYEPYSPLRNEELYAVVLEQIIGDKAVDAAYKIRPEFQLDEINKNRQGKVATDFNFTLSDGKRANLHGIKTDYTLIFFNNPECDDCKWTKEVLEHTEIVSQLVWFGQMTILAMYTDADVALWKAAQKDMPEKWLNARDASKGLVVKNKRYAIRAIPSLYLLDKDKRVLLKDATAEQVVEFLIRN